MFSALIAALTAIKLQPY